MASQTVCTDNFLFDKYTYFHTGNMHLITTATYVRTTLHNIIKSFKKKDKDESNSKNNKRTICKNDPHCIIKTPFPFVPYLISREFILGKMAFLAHIQQHMMYQISTSK